MAGGFCLLLSSASQNNVFRLLHKDTFCTDLDTFFEAPEDASFVPARIKCSMVTYHWEEVH